MFADKPLENHCVTQISVRLDKWGTCSGKQWKLCEHQK